jgi:hypothetical protein
MLRKRLRLGTHVCVISGLRFQNHAFIFAHPLRSKIHNFTIPFERIYAKLDERGNQASVHAWPSVPRIVGADLAVT